MNIGVVREIKPGEKRVALTSSGAAELCARGHRVDFERGAGEGAGISDNAYEAAGAHPCSDAAEVWERAELLLKVKEPLPQEYGFLRPELTLFAYLHLAPNLELTERLLGSETTAIAYETVTGPPGVLPLLQPMSEIAGRLAAQNGATCLQEPLGGPGVLMSGAAGVRPARVLVLGGGVVGTNAAGVAVGMGGDVTVLERSVPRLRELEALFGTSALVLMSDEHTLLSELRTADLVIGAVLVSGALAPRLVTADMLELMRDRAVIVDVAIDQGGCFETSCATTHADPTFVVSGIVHYCVANMPGAVPWTATRALTNATLPYVLMIADLGVDSALAADDGLSNGVNVRGGQIVCEPVARAFTHCHS